MAMSMLFRTMASSTRTLAQAMPGASLMGKYCNSPLLSTCSCVTTVLAQVIYTGFVIPTRDMKPWFRWINYINPIAYAFEALMVNEFDGRTFSCANYVPMGPGYETVSGDQVICNSRGAVPGEDFVTGRAFINVSYHYYRSHLWRNFGILIAFILFFLSTYLFTTEIVTAKKSKGEVLLFPRSKMPKQTLKMEAMRAMLWIRTLQLTRKRLLVESCARRRSSTGATSATTLRSRANLVAFLTTSMDGSNLER
jgi:ATP-binding cassette subfamily G (WHITE) protein 2 (PDR)